MPLYEYQCHSCGKKFEVIQKFSDEPLKTHEECGGEVERLISAPAFHFKGTGWYVTDYAKGNSGAPKSDGGKTDATARSEGDSKSGDSKTESKSSQSKPAETKSSESKPAAETKASSSPAPESK
jgi:putative FmdB family regulatory protein